MAEPNHRKLRLKQEYIDLSERRKKLDEFLRGPDSGPDEIDTKTRDILVQQSLVMEIYERILIKRIQLVGIDHG